MSDLLKLAILMGASLTCSSQKGGNCFYPSFSPSLMLSFWCTFTFRNVLHPTLRMSIACSNMSALVIALTLKCSGFLS